MSYFKISSRIIEEEFNNRRDVNLFYKTGLSNIFINII